MKKVFLSAVIAAGMLMSSCKKSDTTSNKTINYAASVTGGTFPSTTTYFMGFENLPTGAVGTSNAVELTSSGQMFSYKGYSYISTFGAPATLRKYGFDNNGKPKELGSFVVAGLKTFGAVYFVSDTEAYASANGVAAVPKLIRFNPATMQITNTINLASIQKPGAGDVFYQGLTHQGNYLFMPVNYQTPSFSNLADSLFVAVIDRTSGTVTKLIADGRTAVPWGGGTENGFTTNVIIKDEAGNIYVQGTNGAAVPSGIVRIKAGETNFDPGYFFNLRTVTGADCLGIYYYGNGKALTCRTEIPANYPFGGSAPDFKYWKIDIASGVSEGTLSTSLPAVYGFGYTFTALFNGKVYFSVPASSSNSIYSFIPSTGAVTKEFDMTAGRCNGFTKLN